MIGQDKVFSTLERILASSKADAAEAVLLAGTNNTTRFANSAVHQNLAVDFARVTFRVARARKLATVFARGARHSYGMFGALSTREGETAVVTTAGARCYQATTSASLNCIATGPDSSGYAAGASRRLSGIDIGAAAALAVERCRRSRSPKELAPGTYEVILEPAAIAEIFSWLSFTAFGSKCFEEKSSFLAGRIGERVMGENVTIVDDAFNAACPGVAFDFEGTPRQTVRLIDRGLARGIVHNRLSARKAGTASTGHALPPEAAADGSLPLYLHMDPGAETVQSLIGGVEDGLLVTRFHYLNGFLDPRKAVMTGMTRDGLMRIKRGRLGAA
jgi:PmbA protein